MHHKPLTTNDRNLTSQKAGPPPQKRKVSYAMTETNIGGRTKSQILSQLINEVATGRRSKHKSERRHMRNEAMYHVSQLPGSEPIQNSITMKSRYAVSPTPVRKLNAKEKYKSEMRVIDLDGLDMENIEPDLVTVKTHCLSRTQALFKNIFPRDKSTELSDAPASQPQMNSHSLNGIPPNVVDLSPVFDEHEFGPLNEYPKPVYFGDHLRLDEWAMSSQLISHRTSNGPETKECRISNQEYVDPSTVKLHVLIAPLLANIDRYDNVPAITEPEFGGQNGYVEAHTSGKSSVVRPSTSHSTRSSSPDPSSSPAKKATPDPPKPSKQRVLVNGSKETNSMRLFQKANDALSKVIIIQPPVQHALPVDNEKAILARKGGIGRGASWQEGRMRVVDVGVWIKLADRTSISGESGQKDLEENTLHENSIVQFNMNDPLHGNARSFSSLFSSTPESKSQHGANAGHLQTSKSNGMATHSHSLSSPNVYVMDAIPTQKKPQNTSTSKFNVRSLESRPMNRTPYETDFGDSHLLDDSDKIHRHANVSLCSDYVSDVQEIIMRSLSVTPANSSARSNAARITASTHCSILVDKFCQTQNGCVIINDIWSTVF
ncbi:hypothetical protein BC830DRAFT_1129149 [Chytriomyces sp. MP71]|nr:hypothetical protein BC830DRAFT_1129149 [Chytriomyces sp. MP71]